MKTAHLAPVALNMAAALIAPLGAVVARTRGEQVDALWAAADAPGVPERRATQLARLAGKIYALNA